MKLYRLRLEPHTAFGSPIKGDTLFGQLCWTLRNREGEAYLDALLADYTRGRPFAVISDAFPAGFVPRPSLPQSCFELPATATDRKTLKKRGWIPIEALTLPLTKWLEQARSDSEIIAAEKSIAYRELHLQPHNSISRLTGTTGTGFAPYTMAQTWYQRGVTLDIYVLLDGHRLTLSELKAGIDDIGAFGFGRDASIGLGKFTCLDCTEAAWPVQPQANSGLTLAPCAPQGLGLDEQRCFYTVFTRFGRHGDIGVHHGKPFKAPVLLADTGAVLAPLPIDKPFIGQGLGGQGVLSKAIPATVHQGYAPIIPIMLPQGLEDAV